MREYEVYIPLENKRIRGDHAVLCIMWPVKSSKKYIESSKKYIENIKRALSHIKTPLTLNMYFFCFIFMNYEWIFEYTIK